MASILPGCVTLGRSLSLSGPASPLLNGDVIPSSQGKNEAEKREEIFLEPRTGSTNTASCNTNSVWGALSSPLLSLALRCFMSLEQGCRGRNSPKGSRSPDGLGPAREILRQAEVEATTTLGFTPKWLSVQGERMEVTFPPSTQWAAQHGTESISGTGRDRGPPGA